MNQCILIQGKLAISRSENKVHDYAFKIMVSGVDLMEQIGFCFQGGRRCNIEISEFETGTSRVLAGVLEVFREKQTILSKIAGRVAKRSIPCVSNVLLAGRPLSVKIAECFSLPKPMSIYNVGQCDILVETID